MKYKNLEEIIELCNEELDNNNLDVHATLDSEDLKELRDLLREYKGTPKDKVYKYFVSYIYDKGVGNAELGFKKKITSLNDIKEIQSRLSQNRNTDVTIMNFTLLEEIWED